MDILWYKIKHTTRRKKETLRSVAVGFLLFCLLYVLTKIFPVSFCLVKRLFGVSCFGCGMTRAFVAIVEFDFIKAIHYNLFSIPLFVGIFIYCIFVFVDIIFGKSFIEKIEKFLTKKVIVVMLFTMVLISKLISRIFW